MVSHRSRPRIIDAMDTLTSALNICRLIALSKSQQVLVVNPGSIFRSNLDSNRVPPCATPFSDPPTPQKILDSHDVFANLRFKAQSSEIVGCARQTSCGKLYMELRRENTWTWRFGEWQMDRFSGWWTRNWWTHRSMGFFLPCWGIVSKGFERWHGINLNHLKSRLKILSSII